MSNEPEEHLITLKFASRCRLCRQTIAAGERAWWAPGRGVHCWDGGTSEAVCADALFEGDPEPRDWGDL